MFTLNEKDTGLPREVRGRIAQVLNSINEPKIAAADHPAEPTQAYICVSAEGEALSMHIVLYLTKSKVRVMYTWDAALTKKKLKEVESEALDFVENMGFMMDNMNLTKFTEAQRKELLDSLPIFVEEAKPAEPEPLLLTEEELEDLLPIGGPGDSPEQPTAVASSAADLWKKRKGVPAEFDESKSLEMIEAEFVRGEVPVDPELGALLSSAAPPVKAETRKEAMPAEPNKFKTVLRLLASL